MVASPSQVTPDKVCIMRARVRASLWEQPAFQNLAGGPGSSFHHSGHGLRVLTHAPPADVGMHACVFACALDVCVVTQGELGACACECVCVCASARSGVDVWAPECLCTAFVKTCVIAVYCVLACMFVPA
jgi:hypothetical protein